MSGVRTPEDFTEEELRLGRARMRAEPVEPADPRVEALVSEVIGRVADKWTMLVLEELVEHGEQRFRQLNARVPGISQKMLTQTLRQMERDGFVVRTVHPVVPPHVDYRLTPLGMSLGSAFCDVWIWAEQNLERIEEVRRAFEEKQKG